MLAHGINQRFMAFQPADGMINIATNASAPATLNAIAHLREAVLGKPS